MRLWSLHPRYLDASGLTALWREGLLARSVLLGKTKGYRHHPQLERFRAHRSPAGAINSYLETVWQEADARGYSFDRTKLRGKMSAVKMPVPRGQLEFERKHLLRKLRVRDRARYAALRKVKRIEPHTSFTVVPGGIAGWERV